MSEIEKKGTRISGHHFVLVRNGLKLRDFTDRRDGDSFPTLSAARKGCKSGQCIVRAVDGIVVSVK